MGTPGRRKLVQTKANNQNPGGTVSSETKQIPILYTRGFRLPNYPLLTLSCDPTFRTLRLVWKQQQKSEQQQQPFDLIHVSSPGLLLFPAVLISRLANLPLVMSYHTHLPVYIRSYFASSSSWLPPWNSLFERATWKILQLMHSFADLTLVTSPQMAQEMTNKRIANIVVWKKGINTTRFHPSHKSFAMRERMSDGKSQELLLVYIGRLAKEKQLKHLKAVLEQLGSKKVPARLCFVGSGPEEEKLREYFAETSTTFLGRLDGMELSQAFASGDIFVMPSDSETLGFVVLEAMASGIPCVAARAGGLMDLIDHNRNGFLVPPHDISAYCDAIIRLHNDPNLYRQISASGRQETERWSWYSSMEQLRLQAYPQAMQNFSTRLEQRVFRWLRQKLLRNIVG